MYNALGVESRQFGNGVMLAPAITDTQRPMPLFLCPSDLGSVLNDQKDLHGKSNYLGVMGNITMLTFDYPTATTENGVIYLNSNISIGEITDGSSHALIVGECSLSGLNPGHNGAIVVNGWSVTVMGSFSKSPLSLVGTYRRISIGSPLM